MKGEYVMSKRKSVIIMLILFLAIGFATVSTTLVLNGILAVGENKDDFNIIFTSARLDGRKRNDFISEDKKHINFVSNELKTLDDKAILTYEITNTSRNYDADITLTCTAGTTELITLEYTPHQMDVPAGETKTGTLTVSMLKVVDSPIEVPIKFTFTAAAKERVDLGDEYVPPFSRSGVMMKATNGYSNPTGMWAYRSNITKIEFEDKLIPKETTDELTFDVSEKQDKSVMAYLVANKEELTTNKDANRKDLTDTTAYTLYIQGDTGVIANKNSSNIFAYFNNLKEIKKLQYMDTSEAIDMTFMFDECKNLTTLNVSSFDTSNVTDMGSMFSGCSSLAELNLSNFDTSKVTDMRCMFLDCTKLTSLDISGFDTSNVTDMYSMFNGCANLTNLNVSGFDTKNTTDMYSMFMECTNLTSLDVSGFDTSKVTNMMSMFSECTNLTSLDVSSFDTSQVTNMKAMFSSCANLANLNVSNFKTDNVTNMESMFYNCKELIVLDVSNFNTSKVENMIGMFANCSKIQKLDLSSFYTSSLRSIGREYYYGMFHNCNSLIYLDLSNVSFNTIETYDKVFYSMPTQAIVKVKDELAQKWILDLTGKDRPSEWTDENVTIKVA